MQKQSKVLSSLVFKIGDCPYLPPPAVLIVIVSIIAAGICGCNKSQMSVKQPSLKTEPNRPAAKAESMPVAEPNDTAEQIQLIRELKIDDIGRLFVKSRVAQATMSRDGGRLVVDQIDGYPANTKMVENLLSQCARIKGIALDPNDSNSVEVMGVTDDSARSVVKFYDRDMKLIQGLAIGNVSNKQRGRYVRLETDGRIYITRWIPVILGNPNNYINKRLFSVKHEQTQSVTVSYPGGGYKLNSADNDKAIVLESPMPNGKKFKPGDYVRVYHGLMDVSFDRVFKRFGDTEARLNFDRRFVCRLKDSTTYIIDIAVDSGRYYVKCTAGGADDFQSLCSGWIYQISAETAKPLIMQLPDLLEIDAPKD